MISTVSRPDVPAFSSFFQPILQALRELGGSAAAVEIEDRACRILGLSEEITTFPHMRFVGTAKEQTSSQTEAAYRIRWALTYLKKVGYVENSSRGVWASTQQGRDVQEVDKRAIIQQAQRTIAEVVLPDAKLAESFDSVSGEPSEILASLNKSSVIESSWQDDLLEVMLAISPAQFERLAQRVLREAGFEEVRVTGKSGDGGIDGIGTIRLNDLVTMNAVFQCKRYQGSVGSPEIRNFRGAMMGRADRGIFITTSTYTPSAREEAMRDGVVPIDLIDGKRLMELLKKLQLGVHSIVKVEIDRKWFESI